ncbi:hypothetical protein F4678DRAFT_462282 [Xylaria arbuscula]|nr:hypothetical protein F4678DRAFT_462282 [Xylaria arbuscula]
MDRLGFSRDLPSSPWATRFPDTTSMYLSKDKNHSLFAPEFPRIDDPKYYDREPVFMDRPPHNNEDIDKVFWSEGIQRAKLGNLRTWQLISLHRYLQFSPETGFISGGHQLADPAFPFAPTLNPEPMPLPGQVSSSQSQTASVAGLQSASQAEYEDLGFKVYERERIKIDEKTWLPFIQKNRWFDWEEVTDSPKTAGRTWSVDDPKIWEVMRVVIELANRILLALRAKIGALQTILYGTIDYWDNYEDEFGEPYDENATVLLTLAREQEICEKRGIDCGSDYILNYSTTDWLLRLNTLLSKIILSFARLEKSVDGLTTCGAHSKDHDYIYSSIVFLQVGHLESMLSPDLALEELCIKLVHFAITIVHELMHGIIVRRFHEDGDPQSDNIDLDRSGQYPDEPFLNGEGIAEAGAFMEQFFFGGVAYTFPPALVIDLKGISLPLALYWKNFPHPKYHDRECLDGAYLQDGFINAAPGHVPSAWCSKILGESFWNDDTYPKKSDNSFHRNSILTVRERTKGGLIGYYRRPLMQDLSLLPNSYPEDAKVLETLKERMRLWDSHRASWYDRDFAEWNESLLSSGRRDHPSIFADAFSRKDLHQCYSTALFLTSTVRDNDIDDLTSSMPSEDLRSARLVWYTIGLLMMASMPIVQRSFAQTQSTLFARYTAVSPSREAAAAGHKHMVFYDIPEADPPTPEVVECRKFWNVLRHGDESIEMHDQMDYLQLIEDVFGKFSLADGAVMETPFLDAIMHALSALKEDRENIKRVYGSAHSSKWATDWFFKMPRYDPVFCSWVNGKWYYFPRAAPYN